ncbi:glycosyltransferase [Kitasatospora sp. NPDC008050]|uniref:glycosyltransferase n=1 Tax=Kitasatospora sp. NPDC008050 TaxID=3364021 RepID=UPI0036F16D6C
MNVLLCPLADPGFRYPAIAVGLELRRRGHTVRMLDAAPDLETPTPAELDPLAVADLADPRSFRVRRWFLHSHPQCQAVLHAARESRPDVLVTSMLCHGALLAAELLDLPVVVLGLAAHLWPYRREGRQEEAPVVQREWRLRETVAQYQQARAACGLAPLDDRSAHRALAGSALLLRGDPLLEEEGAELPSGIRQIGPCWWEPPPPEQELAQLDAHTDRVGKPVVYVHLGRSFGGRSLWPRLNSIFRQGPYQAVVELGRSGAAQQEPGTDIVVVRKPWMAPLVQRSLSVLSNASSAGVLAALLGDRPLVVAPAGGEQHVLAEACLRAGVAVRLPAAGGPNELDPHDGWDALRAAVDGPAVHRSVGVLGERLRQAKSEAVAADAVEAAAR